MTIKPRIYLASPYSHKSIDTVLYRFAMACKAAAYFIERGHWVFSPIAGSHNIASFIDNAAGWEFWQDIDRSELDLSDELWVLELDGWQESKGIQAELDYFFENYPTRPIRSVNPITMEVNP